MMLLTSQVYYSVVGAVDAIDKLRSFAQSLGWTVDYWYPNSSWDTGLGWIAGTEQNLQLWSSGWGGQDLCYRFRVKNVNTDDDYMQKKAITPGYRNNIVVGSTHPIDQWDWGPATSDLYSKVSVPSSTFTALYLFGTKQWITAVFQVSSTSVISIDFGTIDLYRSWKYRYSNDFQYAFITQSYSESDTYSWRNMATYPNYWNWPCVERGTSTGGTYTLWFDGVRRDYSVRTNNFRPTSSQNNSDNVLGDFNKLINMVTYNAFTDKVVAFPLTEFVKDPTLGVYYPAGQLPFAVVNGRDLTIGQTLQFGTDQYVVLPGVFTAYDLWRAFKVA